MRQEPCPKCGVVREENCFSPEWQCPCCGIAYDKFKRPTDRTTCDDDPNPPLTPETVSQRTRPFFSISFRVLRIYILLLILIWVGVDAWLTKRRAMDWTQSLWVAIYPINGDGSVESESYIQSLSVADFNSISEFMASEAQRLQLKLRDPVIMKLAPEVKTRPPEIPAGDNILEIIWWSLKVRYWAISSDTFEGPSPNIRLFVMYYDPSHFKVLPHSVGLEKGMLGIANVFSDGRQAEQNNVVILHEIMHTLGASDKYDLSTGHPIYPEGFAEPDKMPRFPQQKAELMGGRIPISETVSVVPRTLLNAMIGEKTAREMHWIN